MFLLGVLKDYDFFESQIGTFKQVKGVQMGSTIAPLIANTFIGCLKRTVYKKQSEQGFIHSWTRYTDDNIAFILKESHDEVLNT